MTVFSPPTDDSEVIQARLKWLGGRLARRAIDARQAEEYTRRLHAAAYPYAERLANIHAAAARLYEEALAEVQAELDSH